MYYSIINRNNYNYFINIKKLNYSSETIISAFAVT